MEESKQALNTGDYMVGLDIGTTKISVMIGKNNVFPKMGSPSVMKRSILSKKRSARKKLDAKKVQADKKKRMDEWKKWFS